MALDTVVTALQAAEARIAATQAHELDLLGHVTQQNRDLAAQLADALAAANMINGPLQDSVQAVVDHLTALADAGDARVAADTAPAPVPAPAPVEPAPTPAPTPVDAIPAPVEPAPAPVPAPVEPAPVEPAPTDAPAPVEPAPTDAPAPVEPAPITTP